MRTLDYCKKGETLGWENSEVWFDGVKSPDLWIEVNAAEGWGVRYSQPLEQKDDGSGDVKTEHVEGEFEIRLLMHFSIHLDYRASTIEDAIKLMESIRDLATNALNARPEASLLVFDNLSDQADYEDMLNLMPRH